VQFLPGDERVVVSSGEEKAFRVYEGAKLLSNQSIPGSGDFEAAAVEWPSSASSIVTASQAGVYRVQISSGDAEATVSPSSAHQLLWAKDARVLLTVQSEIPAQTSVVRFFVREGETIKLAGELAFAERVDGMALSRDNRILAVTQYPSDTLKVIDLHTGSQLFSTRTPKYVGSLDFSPDGRWLAMGGEALVVLNLVRPDQSAHYGHFYNNINTVRFSPSGDVVVTSSYDGRLRIFAFKEPNADHATTTLELVKELRHTGQSNVYGFDFRSDGAGLVSAGGDQTVRWFGSTASLAKSPEMRVFEPLEELRRREAKNAPVWPAEPPKSPPFRLESISSVQPTRLPLGRYGCKITMMYKLRDCTVTKNAVGQTILSFGDGNLLSLDAIVTDDGQSFRLLGALRETSSIYDCGGCTSQPIYGVLRGGPKKYEGIIILKRYYDAHNSPELPPLDARIEEAQDRFPIVLEYRGAL
jgi:hypothetical protein